MTGEWLARVLTCGDRVARQRDTTGSFRKLGVPYVGAFIIRILLFRVITILGSPIFGNSQIRKTHCLNPHPSNCIAYKTPSKHRTPENLRLMLLRAVLRPPTYKPEPGWLIKTSTACATYWCYLLSKDPNPYDGDWTGFFTLELILRAAAGGYAFFCGPSALTKLYWARAQPGRITRRHGNPKL